jgi:hypothetical protein
MKPMKTRIAVLVSVFIAISRVGAASGGGSAPENTPVKVAVAVSPQKIGAGADTVVTVRLDPKPGIKLNKYPKIKLQIPAVPGLVDAAEQSLGNPAPPPADQLDANYFHGSIDPLTITLHLDALAVKGQHDILAKLSYFYCVAASGYCAPAKTELKIPVTVR